MEIPSLGDTLRASYQTIEEGLLSVLPILLAALLVFVAGWVFAALVEKLVAQIVRAMKVDKALEAAKVHEALGRAGFRLDAGRFLGALVKWFIIIVFLYASLSILGLSEVTAFLEKIAVGFLPDAISAVLIILAAAIIAEAVQKTIVASAKAAGVSTANMLGALGKWSIWIFAIIAALHQLGIARDIVLTLFQGINIAFGLGIGLAFGLGGQEAAARYIEKLRGEIKKD